MWKIINDFDFNYIEFYKMKSVLQKWIIGSWRKQNLEEKKAENIKMLMLSIK